MESYKFHNYLEPEPVWLYSIVVETDSVVPSLRVVVVVDD